MHIRELGKFSVPIGHGVRGLFTHIHNNFDAIGARGNISRSCEVSSLTIHLPQPSCSLEFLDKPWRFLILHTFY